MMEGMQKNPAEKTLTMSLSKKQAMKIQWKTFLWQEIRLKDPVES